MYQNVTNLHTTKYSSLLRCGAEQFPVFWKCYNPSKQWKLLTPCLWSWLIHSNNDLTYIVKAKGMAVSLCPCHKGT